MRDGHRYDAAGLRRLQTIAGSSEPVLRALEVSSGPWPGFNALQTLLLTSTTLYRVQTSRLVVRPNAVLDVFDRGEISGVTWSTGPLGWFGRLRLVADGHRRSFVSAWTEGSEFADALQSSGSLA